MGREAASSEGRAPPAPPGSYFTHLPFWSERGCMWTPGTVLGTQQAHRHSGGQQPYPGLAARLTSLSWPHQPPLSWNFSPFSLPVLPESFSLQHLPPLIICGLPEAMSWSVLPTSEFLVQATQCLACGMYSMGICRWLGGDRQDVCMGEAPEELSPVLLRVWPGAPRWVTLSQPHFTLEETPEAETVSSYIPQRLLYLCCPESPLARGVHLGHGCGVECWS